jgi:outer membrane lipoprotein LolB
VVSTGRRADGSNRRAFLLGSAVLLLQACAGGPPRRPASAVAAPLSAHEARAIQIGDFELEGRVALSDGRDGGSGRLRWQQGGALLQVGFNSGLAGRHFELRSGPEGAELSDNRGLRRQDQDVDRLLREAWGIEVPVHALSYWMRGARQPDHDGLIKLDDGGLPIQLQQHGWQVDYLRWQEPTERLPALPTKLYARRGNQSVRLLVQRWSI